MDNWLEMISPCHRIVGDADTHSGWVEAMRTIYDHELVIFSGASYVTEIERERYECPAGSYIIVPPGVRHVSRAASHEPGRRHWVHFDWVYAGDSSKLPWMTYSPARPMEELFHLAPSFVPKEILHGPVPRMALALDLFRRIASLYNSGSGRERIISRGLFLELLLELLAPALDEAAPREQAFRLASKIRRSLNKFAEEGQGDSESSLQTHLAKDLGLSYAHQCRVFKSCYGIAPLKYVGELRMTRVKALLRDTSASIAEIGMSAGFENPCYFSRAFRKSVGMSPREYRDRGESGS